jgi:hypothetical protein
VVAVHSTAKSTVSRQHKQATAFVWQQQTDRIFGPPVTPLWPLLPQLGRNHAHHRSPLRPSHNNYHPKIHSTPSVQLPPARAALPGRPSTTRGPTPSPRGRVCPWVGIHFGHRHSTPTLLHPNKRSGAVGAPPFTPHLPPCLCPELRHISRCLPHTWCSHPRPCGLGSGTTNPLPAPSAPRQSPPLGL